MLINQNKIAYFYIVQENKILKEIFKRSGIGNYNYPPSHSSLLFLF